MSNADTPSPAARLYDRERILEFEFVRATENAALQAIHWSGRGEKEKADAAACAAIAGVFEQLDNQGEVVIGEGLKDEAHSILMRARSGTVRHIQAVHQLDRKEAPMRGDFMKLLTD